MVGMVVVRRFVIVDVRIRSVPEIYGPDLAMALQLHCVWRKQKVQPDEVPMILEFLRFSKSWINTDKIVRVVNSGSDEAPTLTVTLLGADAIEVAGEDAVTMQLFLTEKTVAVKGPRGLPRHAP